MSTDSTAQPRHYDTIVVGGGPAGLTAGIYLARARVKTLIIDAGTAGGQVVLSHQIANYPGVPDASGGLLARTMAKQAKSFGCRILTQSPIEAMDLKAAPKTFTVEDEGTFTADTVIIATGGVPRKLGLASELTFGGRGVSYCATCDGEFFAGQEVVAIGGGNSALEEAVSLARYAAKVTIIHEFDHFQAQQWAIDEATKDPKVHFLMNQRVTGFEGGETLERVRVTDKATGESAAIPAQGCFVFIGYVPNTHMLEGVVALNGRGEILADEDLKTSLPNVFAAGDCRVKHYRQITTAVADGTIAALSAIDALQARARPPAPTAPEPTALEPAPAAHV